MTLDEFQENWKQYKLVLLNGKEIIFKDSFWICFKTSGGLMFDTGGPQGSPGYIFKTDEQNNCFVKTDWRAPRDEAWKLCGKLEKL